MNERSAPDRSGSAQAGRAALAAVIATALAGCAQGECELEPGVICTVVGLGVAGTERTTSPVPPLDVLLFLPIDTAVSPEGELYILDWNNHAVRVLRNGRVEHVIGRIGELGDAPEGPALSARLNHPTDLAFDRDGTILVAAWHNSRVLRYDPRTGEIFHEVGTGARSFNGDGLPASDTELDLPAAVAMLPDGSYLVADQANHRLRRVALDGTVETIAGSGEPGYAGDGGPATEASFRLSFSARATPSFGMHVDERGAIYMADTDNHVVRLIDGDGIITTIAGTGASGNGAAAGEALATSMNLVSDVTVDASGNVYIADTMNSCIRRRSPDGSMDTVAGICGERGYSGDGGAADRALLNRPFGVEVDASADILYIADTQNHVIRAVGL
jgi:DNA-binding beta-propeller fold protein YncE